MPEKNTSKASRKDATKLKRNFEDCEAGLRHICVQLAAVQHLFNDAEFADLMHHVDALETAMRDKKKLIGA
ncbi:hypothetical protein BN1012_Phect572 [Candidatus Phaeomarinobacter ectocarpi]|uniref:Uncharacterized protein n=1 Tax=Candidatus Phaeomarinibacter ectocarpi TaxID=1458461 RepID=X5MLY3_9HYPH|nr:hypothetical protein [Candidatus Phaeomarinobacter ectocarpi]CDO58786.1 hypothetical protein BN1012_Phect572 [Candidatus Phaeomarinobacter ectocarpi]